MEDERWQQYKHAVQVIAQAMGTTVHCQPKNGYLRVNFKADGLTVEQDAAMQTITELVELVTGFPPGYLEQLEVPKDWKAPK